MVINGMDKDSKRFDRVSNYIDLKEVDLKRITEEHFSTKDVCAKVLTGGFANTNYLIEIGNEANKYVLRLPQKNKTEFKKELAVIEFVSKKVKVPSVHFSGKLSESEYAIFDFIEGDTFNKVLSHGGKETLDNIASDIGKYLALIHSFEFPHSGFFNEKFEFIHKFENFGQGYIDYMNECLQKNIAVKRMGKPLSLKIQNILEKYTENLRSLKETNRLNHCDYNGKNILVDDFGVTAILDWEFACSGSPLVDLGNFLRFKEDYPQSVIDAFIDGYKQQGGFLPENWMLISRLLDLASMCSFITREGNIPKTIKTALSVFERGAEEL